jgi:hypothetical protein
MKYMIMIYGNAESRAVFERLSPAQVTEGLGAYEALRTDLAAAGEFVVSEALAEPADGRRLSVDEDGAITTDGPFAEAKEHLAGFFLVDCEDMATAVRHASRIPEAAHGLVEVRPVRDLNDFRP